MRWNIAIRRVLPLLFMLVFLGCSATSVSVGETATPASVHDMTSSKTIMIDDFGDDDEDIMHILMVAASEGKAREYDYFAIIYPYEVNNILGSPITNSKEFISFCSSKWSGNCPSLFYTGKKTTRMKVVYFKEPPVEFLTWSIDGVLKESAIAGLDPAYVKDSEFEYWNSRNGRDFDFTNFMQ